MRILLESISRCRDQDSAFFKCRFQENRAQGPLLLLKHSPQFDVDEKNITVQVHCFVLQWPAFFGHQIDVKKLAPKVGFFFSKWPAVLLIDVQKIAPELVFVFLGPARQSEYGSTRLAVSTAIKFHSG